MQAREILQRASITLQDNGFVRWPLPELRLYLNDAIEAVALHKQSAVTATVELALAIGTKQSLTDIDETYVSLVRVIRNVGGKAITPTSRNTLDMVMPGWQDTNVLPPSDVVEHVVQDMADPRTFYVVPANDGNGAIEAVVSVLPADVEEPASPLDIDSYTAVVGIPPIFKNALVDFVLYRAYSKDSTDPNSAQRAQNHYQMFANAVGIKVQSDMVTHIKTAKDTA